MIRIFTITMFGLLLFSCDRFYKAEKKANDLSSTNSQNESRLDSSLTNWSEQYDTLNMANLPFELNQTKWRRNFIVQFYKKLGQNSIPSNFPVTVIFKNDNYTGVILVVDELPVLVTYDKLKNPIDELFILDDYGMNPKKEVSEFAKINKDLSIHLVDSIYTYKLDNNEHQIPGTVKFSTVSKYYQIDEKGKILLIVAE